jgi:homogentisate 1,2-dioxygenase
MRWFPPALPSATQQVDFLDSISTMAGIGEPCMRSGLGIHMYCCNKSMTDRAFCNADGDLLVVPQEGKLRVVTEHGVMDVEPNEIFVIQRGIRFSVHLLGSNARGYILEVFKGHFKLPDLGPIGSNGLANPRDFKMPQAWYEDRVCSFHVVQKFGGHLFETVLEHSPFDVVGWHGNYTPYKYDLRRFNCMNSVSFDHPDPSIYTVLTCPSDEPGTAIADFVIFPPRWMVMENSFRPPWFHRNCMSEFMGMIWGEYDAKAGGFQAGGASLHNTMTPHGPDGETCVKAINADLKPHKFNSGLAFMFESQYTLRVTKKALDAPHRDVAYQKCWKSIEKTFDPDAAPRDDSDKHHF